MIFLKVKSFIQFTSYIQTVEGDTFNLKGLGSSPPRWAMAICHFINSCRAIFANAQNLSINWLFIYPLILWHEKTRICHPRVNLKQMWHLPHLHHICYSFGPDLLTFALRKYGANPFFRPVYNFFLQIAESVPLKEACLLGCCVPTGYGAVVNVAKVCVKSVLRLSAINRNLR